MELLILLNYYYYYYYYYYYHHHQYSTGNQFPVQVTSGKCREPVGGFIRFLMRQSFESEPYQDSALCFYYYYYYYYHCYNEEPHHITIF